MYAELEAPSNDVIAMNMTIAAIDRWLENSSEDKSGQEVGREIGAMYREIHTVVASISPPDEDDDEEDDEDSIATVTGRVAV
ncbi:MAG TPA: hypothetical protein VN909_04415 [Candidatus Dormibacteraeota bacterium]|jgi:hypothetical protein|nr:hypothetical protein [Candidatus Dormibacteraeota bacterium]